jgi:hypothetical protein
MGIINSDISWNICITALLVPLLVLACRGNSSEEQIEPGPFHGSWNLSYDVLIDECGLVPEGSNAFLDTQEVTQTEDLIVVTSSTLSPDEYIGEVRPDSSFETKISNSGDLFGDGINCSLEESLAYTDATTTECSSLYDLRLRCDDGFYCVTALRGTGIRQGTSLSPKS